MLKEITIKKAKALQAWRDAGATMTLSQYLVLDCVDRGLTTAGEIVAELHGSTAAVHATMDKMRGYGWLISVARTTGKTRCGQHPFVWTLTARGVEVLTAHRPIYDAATKAL